MEHKKIVVEGMSIIDHLIDSSKEKDDNYIIKSFIGHIRSLISENDPENFVVVLPRESRLTSDHAIRIGKILINMGVTSAIADRHLVGAKVSDIVSTMSLGNERCLVSSSSIALAQEVSSKVDLYSFTNGQVMSEKGLKSTTGLLPNQIPDLVAMMGDKSFGFSSYISGSHASQWLAKYGTINGIDENASSIPRAMSDLFKKSLNAINQQSQTTSFKNSASSIDSLPESYFSRKKVNSEALYELFIESKIYDWLPDELKEKYVPKLNLGSETTYTNIPDGSDQSIDFKNRILSARGASIAINGDIASFSIKPGESFIFDLSDDKQKLLALEILSSKSLNIVTHEAKSILEFAKENDIDDINLVSDSSVLSYTINSKNSEKTVYALAHECLGIEISNKVGSKDAQSAERAAGEKSDLILRVNRELFSQALLDKDAIAVFNNIELPLIPVLNKMESNGFLVDTTRLSSHGDEMLARMDQISAEINNKAGKEIKIGTSASVAEYLYEILNLPILKRTPGGAPSTSEDALSELIDKEPTIEKIMEYRALSKLHSTYIKGLISKADKKSSRVHTSFMQNVTATGRLSSRDPNLQNIPIRSSDGKRIRQAFVAPKDSLVLAVDYSQIELRVLAHLSQDEKLLKAFNSGIDIHRATAADVFGISPEDVTGEQRRYAKQINFGIVYGMSAFGLSQKLGISVSKADSFISKYFDTYKGVRKYLDNVVVNARNKGFVETISGRKLYHPNLNHSNQSVRKAAERAVVNAPMQGTASDIIKKAMIDVDKNLTLRGFKAKMLIQVHDELVFEVPKEELKAVHEMVKETMESAYQLSVPLLAEADAGLNWESSHSLDGKNDILEQELSL